MWQKDLVCKFVFNSCHLARRPPSSTDTLNSAGVTNPSQYDEVEMTQNPAYGPVAATVVKKEPQYEVVAPPSGDWNN